MNYDGEVLIHAGITTDDISKDVKEVSGELGGLGKVLQKLGFKISNAMSKPVTGTVKQIKKDIEDCAKALEKYRAQLYKAQDDKKPFDRQAASMDAERDAARWRLEQLKAQQKAAQKALELPEGRMATASELDAYMDAQARLPQINEDLSQQQAKVDALEKKWKGVCDKIDKYELKIDQAKQLIAANEQKAAELAEELKEAEEASQGINENSKPVSKDMDKMSKKVSAFGSRLKSIVMGAFIFNGISAGLRELTSYFGSVLKTNQAFTAELSKLKGALLTAFQPIYNAVAPALTQLIRLLTSAVLAVAQFFAAISGTSLKDSAASAKNLYEEAKALDSVGSAAKKAGKSMAGFDEINTLQDPNASGGGAGSSGATEPDFSFGDWDEAAGKGIVDTIATIAVALGGLSLGKFIADLLTANIKTKTLANSMMLFGKKAKMAAGVALTITGAFIETKGIIDAINNGLNTGSFTEILVGGGGIAAGGALIGSFFGKSLIGGAIGMIIAGIPALFTSIHDAAENGINWLNGSLIAISETAIGTGIGILIAGPVGAGIGALIGFGAGLFTDAIVAAGKGYTAIAVDTLNETEKALVQRAQQSADAFVQQVADTSAEISKISSETAYLEKLESELLGLVDAEGKVQECDQARFDLLSTKLNEALGTEITRTGDLVNNYGELKTAIENAIAEKKALAMLEAYEDDWIQAMKDEQEAMKANNLLFQDYQEQLKVSSEKQAEYAKEKEKLLQRQQELEEQYGDVAAGQLKEYYDQEMAILGMKLQDYDSYIAAEQALIDEKKAKYDESNEHLYLYHEQVKKYEDASMQVMQGNYQEAINILNDTGEAYHQTTNKVDEEVARKLDALWATAKEAEMAARHEKENFEKGIAGFTEESVKEAEEGYKAALAAYDNAYEDAYGKGRDVGTGLADSFEDSKKSVWQKAKELMAAAFNGMNSAGSSGTEAAIASSAVSQSMYSLRSSTATPAIPQLARGAVLPANKPFMAVVGDQRHGTNVEAPLATIQEAVALVMADQMGGMMAGFNAVTERQERILQAIFGLDISDGALAAAVQRHQDKMSTVTGGIA